VQEAIAARCPMIVNQVIPGQEEGNAQLICANAASARWRRKTARSPNWWKMPSPIARASGANGAKHLKRVSKPDAAERIAELVLDECEHDASGARR
jgi:processive 1,2-diacylglycerol beta-glucosyltransferase